MREILKYLRQTNSFTQEEIVRKIEISRQTYIKYENGEVEPGDWILVAGGVSKDFLEFELQKD